jgi:site-specific recombinase XerD
MAVLKSSLKKRNNIYYLHYFENGHRLRRSLGTGGYQLALEKQRQFDSARARGQDIVLPTKTPLEDALEVYVQHMHVTRTARSVTADLSYLRSVFGEMCPALVPAKSGTVKGYKSTKGAQVIHAQYLEQITTAQIARFIRHRVQSDGISAKTANRTRGVLSRLFTWSMGQNGVRMPGGKNPVANVEPYPCSAPDIRFLRQKDIVHQLHVLRHDLRLQTAVAILLFAGLRREELVWLRPEDVIIDGERFDCIRVCAKTVDGVSWQPKTKVNRVVPVSATLRTYLERYARHGLASEKWYLPNTIGTHWDADGFAQRLRLFNRSENLEWSSLDFRHTFGSHLAMKGESLYKIATLMGNSPEICRKHYAALLPESLMDSVEFMHVDNDERTSSLKPSIRVLANDGR